MKENKKTLRFYFTLWSMKFLTRSLKLIGKNATHLPGNIALKMCPDFLAQIEKPKTIIGVTGTNGKTTVSNLINDILTDNGYNVGGNKFGGNIDAGIAAALMAQSTLSGKATKDIEVLEIDERMTPYILPYVQPNFLVCTNLFRDSYKRNAHSDFIVSILNKQIPKTSKLILNGEDLISNHLAEDNDRVYFGISSKDTKTTPTNNIIKDIVSCPKCNSKLDFEYIRYNHIGVAHCPNCDYGSPKFDYDVDTINYEEKYIIINSKGEREKYRLIGNNATDIYNEDTAITLLREFGLTSDQIEKSLQNIKIVESRFDEVVVNGKKIISNLAKGQNPIACSRVMDFVRQQEGKKAVILEFDDYFDAQHSSENVAWLFDTDFEFLNSDDIVQVITGGPRHKDMKTRMLLAGIPEEKIFVCEKEVDTPQFLDIDKVDTIFVLHDIYTHHYSVTIKNKIMEMLSK